MSPKAPGQDFSHWENLYMSFLVGLVFVVMGELCGLIGFLYGGDPITAFIVVPLITYFFGSLILFGLIELGR